MKGAVVILSIVLAIIATTFTGCVTKVSVPYTEGQFSVTYPETHRINIFAEEGATIEGDWKSDYPVYTWYTSPGGCMYGLGNYGDKPLSLSPFTQAIQEPHHYKDSECVFLLATQGGELDYIVTEPPYGSRGYYTICFKPFNEDETTNIIVRYRVR